ncbi:uncharacterized protein AMSG_12385 [Thecamonas trahens ATCC 50062]|uniref:Protein-serine/threonine phosphatase n=1 Tax=Thecamonas trahens ATCC 50062 TaxID=461836 RepID=A0A0L0DUK3_THETB|nr:hypothetical protein AMSG_12385 [Thecamonas trahens ATCC 50062]KNC55148.1 hypothetical protein AMSG_12385 [Thecamonas trahens ATCC 50062]|eukprot:XP_013753251.1 hypothetical protein AMSG_12385 [Thecamonas trahens ATCC 50062]
MADDDTLPATITIAFKYKKETFTLSFEPTDSVLAVKTHLFTHLHIHPHRQKLIGLRHAETKKMPQDEDLLEDLVFKATKGGHKVFVSGTPDDDLFVDPVDLDADDLPNVVNDLDFDYFPSAETSSSLADSPEVQAKLDKAIADVDIRILNPPREGKKLLVLDLDYTLFDMKSTAESINELKRPFLEEFMTLAYQHYDIVIWSQTKWTYLEMKLTDLGLLTSDAFKLMFVLDISCMFSVRSMYKGKPRTHQVKALPIIWAHFPDRFGPHNTVHIDDVSRNFAVNPQQGLKIKAFKRAAVNRATDRELFRLSAYLIHLATSVPDFRSLDHARWKKVVKKIITSASTYGEPTLRFFTFSSSESQFTYVALSTVNDYNNHVNRTNAVELYRFEHTDILDRSVYKRWLDTLGAPDLLPLYTGPRAREFLDAGKMSDLSDVWDETGLHGDVLPLADALVSGQAGEKFGIPLLATGSMCMYRKSVFRTIGVSTPPQTWDELLALCQAFADVGIPCLGNDLATLPPTQYFDSLAIRMHGNEFYANFTDAGISFTDPRVLAVFDELIPLVGKGYFARTPSPSPGLDRVLVDISALALDRAAVICGLESVSPVLLAMGIPNDDISVFAFPVVDHTSALLGIVGIVGLPTNAAHPHEARDFLRLVARASSMARHLANSPGIVPLRTSLGAHLTSNRSRLVYNALSSTPILYQRSGLAGFGFTSIFAGWSSLILRIFSAANNAEAYAVLDASLPELEALRVRLVLGQAAQPEFSPRSGAFASAVTLTLSSPEEGAVIYFTLDGSEPSFTSSVYSEPIRIATSDTVTVRATAAVQGLSLATPASATYVVNIPPATDSGSVRLSLLLAIVIPVTLVCCGICAAVGYVIYRRKSVTYTLVSDAELVIPPENLRVLHVVGRGSYGTVYAGTWRATSVAIKRMHAKVLGPRELSEFVDEAHTLHLLRHPNIVIFMGVTLEPPAIVTEFMDRGSMYEVLHTAELFLDPSMGLSLATPASATYVVNIPPATDSGSVRLSLLLAIVIPVTLVCCGICAAVGYVIYRRKSVTYTLVSDAELVIPPENLHVLHVVGRGSYGTVYAGTWRATSVAIKRMHAKVLGPRELSEFVDEAHTLHLLRHPNIVIFMGVTLEPPAIVTEFMDRGSMYEILHAPDLAIDNSIALKWAHNIAQGLQYLSHAGIVHGDFKSLNVLFDSSWVPKICDFGMASVKKGNTIVADGKLVAKGRAIKHTDSGVVSAAGSSSILASRPSSLPSNAASRFLAESSYLVTQSLSGDGSVMHSAANVGTVFWAAPEVLTSGSCAMTTQSDAYALGIVLWEIATREDLYPGENVLAVALEILEGRRPDTTSIPTALSGIIPVISALWAQRASDRLDLDAAVAKLGTLYSPENVTYPSSLSTPTGSLIVVHCVLRNARAMLLVNIDDTIARLRMFHDSFPHLAKAAAVTILQWGLGWVTLGVHRPSQLPDVLFLVESLASSESGPIAMLVAEGTIVSSKDSFGHHTLGGPVIETLRASWATMFGTKGSGFDTLSPQTGIGTNARQRSPPPLAEAWDHAVPGGMFIATTTLANQLKSLSKIQVIRIPWLVNDEPVFQLVDASGVAVTDVAKPITARDYRTHSDEAIDSNADNDLGSLGSRPPLPPTAAATPSAVTRAAAALDDLLVNSADLQDSALVCSLDVDDNSHSPDSSTSSPAYAAQPSSDHRPGRSTMAVTKSNFTAESNSNISPSQPLAPTVQSPPLSTSGGSVMLRSSGASNRHSSPSSSSSSSSSSALDTASSLSEAEEQMENAVGREFSRWDLPRWAVLHMMEACGDAWLGSMAMAYEAVLSGQPVVVKVLLRQKMSPGDLVSFAEAAARATLASAVGVVGPIAVCLDAPLLAVVNPRYDTGSLHDAMTGVSPLVLDRRGSYAVATSMTEALAKLHAETGRAHGALRPTNVVLVGANGSILSAHVIDFGFGEVKTSLGTQTMVPTVAYMSPDDLRGSLDSMPGDVFVVGTLLYEMLTGLSAFAGRNAIEVSHAIISGERPQLTEAEIESQAMRRLIASCWLSDAAARPTMAEIATQVAALDVTDFVQTGPAARVAAESAARVAAATKAATAKKARTPRHAHRRLSSVSVA